MERKTTRRYEKRCICGNVVAYEAEKEPKKYECEVCGKKGAWDEKFDFPKPQVEEEIKETQVPAPVFKDGEPYLIIDNKYIPYDEGMVKFYENKKKTIQKKIDELKSKLTNKPGEKK